MKIQYEDSMTCLNCWGDRQCPNNYKSLTQNHQILHQFSSSQKTTKLSLKKPKITQKSHDSSFHQISFEQTNEKWLYPKMKSQQPYIIYPAISSQIKQRPKSTFIQNKEVKITFNHQNSTFVNSVIFNPNTSKAQKEEMPKLDETAKRSKPFQTNRSELDQTKKYIPGSRFSLEEISHLKQSVYSIWQGQQKTKIQESTIMMNYFNPSESRLADYKLNTEMQQTSSFCPQKK